MRRIFYILFSLLTPSLCYAEERLPGPYFLVGAGLSHIDVDPNYSLDGNSDTDTVSGFHFGLGYFATQGVLLEYSRTNYSNFIDIFDLVDGYELEQNKFSLGYAFDLENKDVRIVPKIGVSNWEFTGKRHNGFLFSSTQNLDNIKESDIFYELGLALDANENLSFSLNLHHMNTDFGSFTNLYGILEFGFGNKH